MPSSQLSSLSKEIESRDTDDFGRFYMYLGLLNTIAVRKNTFEDSLPVSLGFFFNTPIDIGKESNGSFTKNSEEYRKQFVHTKADWSKLSYQVAMNYIRRGTLADLTFIIDQMLTHLKAIDGKGKNSTIYNNINFVDLKRSLIDYIEQISMTSHHLLSINDNTFNTTLSGLVAVTGLVAILTSMLYLTPILIGLGLLIGGGIGAYHYSNLFLEQTNQMNTHMKTLQEKTEKIFDNSKNELIKSASVFNIFPTISKLTFFKAIMIPLTYTPLVLLEQLPDEESHNNCVKMREELDKMTDELDKSEKFMKDNLKIPLFN